MSQPNFETMTSAELKAYVVANRHDQAAFYALSDRIRAQGVEFTSLEQLSDIITQKRKSQEVNSND
jgi:hypothetical protein